MWKGMDRLEAAVFPMEEKLLPYRGERFLSQCCMDHNEGDYGHQYFDSKSHSKRLQSCPHAASLQGKPHSGEGE